MEIPKAILEVALEKAKAIRGDALRLLQMAMRGVQREELREMWLGMETRKSAQDALQNLRT